MFMANLELKNVRTNSLSTILIVTLIFSFIFMLSLTQSAFAAFPGENGLIAFSSSRDGGAGEIYVMKPDGSGATRLTFNNQDDRGPAWSADGSKIVFARYDGNDWEIWSMNADGSNQQQLTNNDDNDGKWPAWSPDGSKIVYQKFTVPPDHWDIWVMNADGSGQIKLYDSGHDDEMPVWSPDGSKIALTQYDSTSNSDQIWVINADGTNPMQLTSPPDNTNDANPDWSPDGSKIVFYRPDQTSFEIWVVDSNGVNPTRITSNEWHFTPAWSPDGSKIVFVQDNFEEQVYLEIYTMNSDGSDLRQLTSNLMPDDTPDWQPINIAPVGGVTSPINKLELLAPYITLAGLVIVFSTVIIKKRK
jgi:TolB protein